MWGRYMNRIKISIVLLFVMFTMQKSDAAVSGANPHWSSIIPILQSINSLTNVYTPLNTRTDLDTLIYSYMYSVDEALSYMIDMYNQKGTCSRLSEDGSDQYSHYRSMSDQYTYLSSVLNSSGKLNMLLFKRLYQDTVKADNTFIAPANYSSATVQDIKAMLVAFSAICTGLCQAMTTTISSDVDAITNDTSQDASTNPLNADIFKAQVMQDIGFILSMMFVYIASCIDNTQSAATILYTPQISCSDAIAKSCIVAAYPPAGLAQSDLIGSILSGNFSTTLPTTSQTLTVTPILVYAAVCAFVLAYDANSNSGPYQQAIDTFISVNNGIQSL